MSKDLPASWVIGTIDQVCTHPQYGWTCKAQPKGYLKLLRTTDITSGLIDWDTVPYCSETPKKEADYYLCEGDIVVSRAGSVGKSYIIKGKPPKAVFASYLVRFKPHVEKYYVYYFMQSRLYWSQIEEKSAGIAVPNVNGSKLAKISLPIAPLNEQKRIVDRIEQLFSDIDKGEELLKTVQKQLATYRQSVLKAAVTGELTKDWREKNKKKLESGEKLLARILESRRKNWSGKGKYKDPVNIDEPYFEVPDGWALTRLETISQRVTDGTHQSPKFQESGVPFVVIGDVRGGFIDWDSVSKWVSEETYEENTRRCRPEKDDILYTAVGSYGIALRVKDKKKFMFQRHIAHIKPVQDMLNLDYIVFVLNSPTTLSHAHKVARGVAQKTVTLGELSNFQIPIPPREEQEIIVDRVSHALSQIDAFETLCTVELKRSATLRQSILKSAFSGKLVAQDPADEPASELLARIKSGDSPKAKAKVAAPRRGRKPRSGKSEAA